jgi:hypothetical protein
MVVVLDDDDDVDAGFDFLLFDVCNDPIEVGDRFFDVVVVAAPIVVVVVTVSEGLVDDGDTSLL